MEKIKEEEFEKLFEPTNHPTVSFEEIVKAFDLLDYLRSCGYDLRWTSSFHSMELPVNEVLLKQIKHEKDL